jgi:hypothetical protein
LWPGRAVMIASAGKRLHAGQTGAGSGFQRENST